MIDGLIVLTVVLSFWICLTVGMIRGGGSWFPFTIVVPILLLILGIVVNQWLHSLGTIIIVGIHAVLWLLLIWMWVRDRLVTRDKVDNDPQG
jgi:hypothetical protein